jgi:folylpolyglutamate synthase/dihydropteroate synthase
MPAPDLRAALAAAAAVGPQILIAGSLFLVGEARTLLLGAPTDPMLVTDPPAR